MDAAIGALVVLLVVGIFLLISDRRQVKEVSVAVNPPPAAAAVSGANQPPPAAEFEQPAAQPAQPATPRGAAAPAGPRVVLKLRAHQDSPIAHEGKAIAAALEKHETEALYIGPEDMTEDGRRQYPGCHAIYFRTIFSDGGRYFCRPIPAAQVNIGTIDDRLLSAGYKPVFLEVPAREGDYLAPEHRGAHGLQYLRAYALVKSGPLPSESEIARMTATSGAAE